MESANYICKQYLNIMHWEELVEIFSGKFQIPGKN